MNTNYIALIALFALLFFLLRGTNVREHAAGSPGTLIQLATSSTEFPHRDLQTYHNSRGYVFPTYIHNDWDPYTYGVQRGHNHHGTDEMAHTRNLGYSYEGGNTIIYVLIIVALMGYIMYKKN
jgi:hypothetical protein